MILENGLLNPKDELLFYCKKVENNYKGNLNLQKDGMPKTTKMDGKKHGIGLQNVKQVVHKYAGRYSINVKDEKYWCKLEIR